MQSFSDLLVRFTPLGKELHIASIQAMVTECRRDTFGHYARHGTLTGGCLAPTTCMRLELPH